MTSQVHDVRLLHEPVRGSGSASRNLNPSIIRMSTDLSHASVPGFHGHANKLAGVYICGRQGKLDALTEITMRGTFWYNG